MRFSFSRLASSCKARLHQTLRDRTRPEIAFVLWPAPLSSPSPSTPFASRPPLPSAIPGSISVVKGIHRKVSNEFIQELKDILQDNMTLDYEERCFHGKLLNSYHRAVNVPDVIVFPRSQDDVQKFVIECNKYTVPIVPYGGATSIEGQTLAPHGGVCIDMSLMKKIKSLNVDDLDIVVERGIGWIELNEYLKPYGLFFPLDPVFRYGTMRENVINLQAVLANGEVVKTGSRARKSAAEYDLAHLLIGSEGTLVLRKFSYCMIQGQPDFDLVLALNAFWDTEAYAQEQMLIVQKIVSEHNGSDFVYVEDAEAKEELWKIRKRALWACYAMAPNNYEAITTDVCVPLSRLAECISKSKQELDASPLLCMVIAHAGDGNFHTVIIFDPDQEEQCQEAERLNHFMIHTALSMEGTCTGEHGVATGKMKYLEKELGTGALRTMKRIKSVLDPNDIMNPGKLIPPHICI
ncbi:hypothetical protein OPV22_031852 [Ensete ventricosum]|uniref:D-lactate dehydrogenase (cytochrome) n=1 Tax=Ensete ventricosum TaxID=4639 RepID=A0AAV8PLI8_ENSVE|nr:hypothetical protein OPV22_031852 [Ensete ventricosum]